MCHPNDLSLLFPTSDDGWHINSMPYNHQYRERERNEAALMNKGDGQYAQVLDEEQDEPHPKEEIEGDDENDPQQVDFHWEDLTH